MPPIIQEDNFYLCGDWSGGVRPIKKLIAMIQMRDYGT